MVSDAHEGLKNAISKVLTDAAWQRCRVHFMCNLLSTVPKGAEQIETVGEQIGFTADGAEYLTDPSTEGLATLMSRNVAGVDEILLRLEQGPESMEGLLTLVRDDLGVQWEPR